MHARAQIIGNFPRADDPLGRPGTEANIRGVCGHLGSLHRVSQLLSNRSPACVEGTYYDQKQEYHLEWPNLRVKRRVGQYNGINTLPRVVK